MSNNEAKNEQIIKKDLDSKPEPRAQINQLVVDGIIRTHQRGAEEVFRQTGKWLKWPDYIPSEYMPEAQKEFLKRQSKS